MVKGLRRKIHGLRVVIVGKLGEMEEGMGGQVVMDRNLTEVVNTRYNGQMMCYRIVHLKPIEV